MRRFVVVLLILGVLGVSLAYLELRRPVTPPAETIVEVVPGMGTRAIAGMLADHRIIRNRYVFDLWHLVRGGTLKAGEYQFVQPATLTTVYNRILRGDVYTRTVVIPEGFNLFDIAQAIENAQLGSKERFLEAASRNVSLIADLDPGAKTLEGYLFPDTYRFPRHLTPGQMQAVMVRRFRQNSAAIGLEGDYHQIVTLASLVEKETPVAADRPLVASVLCNRLKKDMPLMTDPTVIYAAMLENQYRGTIYESDLKRDSAYNTYRHAGLPPGPICSPGTASLQAAMHPADSNFLYFVADPAAAGHSRFAATLEEHEQNVTAYRRGLKEAQGAR
ncbi:MAG TPA: endolytic transglycosylase MltG [Acidobacteriaceae bacterium]|nr:endolytic transglycosylase MltG [Acidobacteriaceae bacterium]